mmetsp:Transcript_100063/g.254431  ORF Transcript_100063/g.254431 Transcript_100063/m.254431 type:complete len:200 (+) Transcript_100063:502-1101(+)
MRGCSPSNVKLPARSPQLACQAIHHVRPHGKTKQSQGSAVLCSSEVAAPDLGLQSSGGVLDATQRLPEVRAMTRELHNAHFHIRKFLRQGLAHPRPIGRANAADAHSAKQPYLCGRIGVVHPPLRLGKWWQGGGHRRRTSGCSRRRLLLLRFEKAPTADEQIQGLLIPIIGIRREGESCNVNTWILAQHFLDERIRHGN